MCQRACRGSADFVINLHKWPHLPFRQVASDNKMHNSHRRTTRPHAHRRSASPSICKKMFIMLNYISGLWARKKANCLQLINCVKCDLCRAVKYRSATMQPNTLPSFRSSAELMKLHALFVWNAADADIKSSFMKS